MKNTSGWVLILLLSFGLFTSLRAADTADTAGYGDLWGSVVVPDGVSLPLVRKSILQAAVGRGWTIKDKSSDGKVVVFHEAGKWVSNVVMTYDKSTVQIYHRTTKNGKPKVPDWLGFLKKDLQQNLNMASIAE
jgi:hypothetical protein